jgi:hypothetical protein
LGDDMADHIIESNKPANDRPFGQGNPHFKKRQKRTQKGCLSG